MKLTPCNLLLRFVLPTVLVLGSFSTCVHSQESSIGEFTLLTKVHWGDAVLPDGDYTYTVESSDGLFLITVRRKEDGSVARFMANTFSETQRSDSGGLILTRGGEDTFVTSMRVGTLGLVFYFSAPRVKQDGSFRGAFPASQPLQKRISSLGFITILSPDHQSIPSAEAEKVYLSACEVVQREFSRSDVLRPRLTLLLGASKNQLNFATREIQLKQWDKYRFAEGVVALALDDLTPLKERLRLRDLAIFGADTTVDVCELKNCKN